MHTATRKILGEVRSPDRVAKRHGSIGWSRVGNVGEHRNGGVAREEQVVDVVRAIETLELVGSAATTRHQIADHADDARRVLPPRTRRHHMMGVHVDDQFAIAPEHRFAGGSVGHVRNDVAAAASGRGGRTGETASRGAVARARVEHREAQRNATGRLQKPTS